MKILGLDIGSYAIKAVELDVTFGRVELADYLVERVVESELQQDVRAQNDVKGTEGQNSDAKESHAAKPASKARPRQLLTPGQLDAIRRLLSDRSFHYDRLAINFPRAWVTTRIFTFPTKDRKVVQSSLMFELDDEIPFTMDDIIHDFTVLNYDGTNSTVFTAVALKSDVSVLLQELQMLGLNPDMITVECWAVSHLLDRSTPKEYEGHPICIVNMGHKQTYIHMHVRNGPLLTHVSHCAGDDITRAIAREYNLTYEQAEKAKIDGAFLLTQVHLSGQTETSVTEEQKQFASVIGSAIAPMIREIKQTLMSYRSQHKLTPRAIFMTGGSSLIMNLPLYIEEQLRLPVFPLSYMSRVVGQTLQLSETSEAMIPTATGLGLSSIKIDRNVSVNLRKDLFAKQGGLGAFNITAYKRPLKWVAASLAFIYLNLIAQGIILSSRSSSQDARVERAIKSVLGAVSPSMLSNYKSSPSLLKSAVNKEIAKYKENQAAPEKPLINALDVLNKVSSGMPRDMTLDVTNFEIKQGKFRLAGIVDQLSNPDRIAKALSDSKLISDVAKGKVEEDQRTKKVKFEITGKIVAEAGNVKAH